MKRRLARSAPAVLACLTLAAVGLVPSSARADPITRSMGTSTSS